MSAGYYREFARIVGGGTEASVTLEAPRVGALANPVEVVVRVAEVAYVAAELTP